MKRLKKYWREEWKAVKNNWRSGKKRIRCNEKNNQLKDDESKNIVLLKDGLKELIESYPNIFGTFVKNELKKLAAREEDIDYKKLSQ